MVGIDTDIPAHIADSSDPHGASFTQTTLSITGDSTVVSSALVRNVVIGVDATPPTASNFTTGTLYVQYTA